jgi:predicted MFS family arabinose efflux permease
VFAKPLAEEFRSNRGSIALAVSLLDLMVTFSAPGAGRLADRYGTRGVIVGSLVALAACLAGLAYVQPPLGHLYALYLLAGLFGAASSAVTYSRVMANWFDRKRGLALGLASTGTGLGAFIGPSLAQFLIEERGWRVAYLGLAGFTLLVAMPVVAIFLRGSPEEVGLAPDGDVPPVGIAPGKATRAGMTVSQAIRTGRFWLLCGIFFLVAGCGTGTISHIAPLLTDRGASGRSAAFAASLFGIASIAGRVGNGYLVDRFFAPRVAAVLFSGAALGIAMLWGGATGIAADAAALLLGLAIGAEADVMPFLISRYFGMRSMAELYGCAFGAYTLGNAAGRYLIARGFDVTGSYRMPLACAFVALTIATIATFGLGRYRDSKTTPALGSKGTNRRLVLHG